MRGNATPRISFADALVWSILFACGVVVVAMLALDGLGCSPAQTPGLTPSERAELACVDVDAGADAGRADTRKAIDDCRANAKKGN